MVVLGYSFTTVFTLELPGPDAILFFFSPLYVYCLLHINKMYNQRRHVYIRNTAVAILTSLVVTGRHITRYKLWLFSQKSLRIALAEHNYIDNISYHLRYGWNMCERDRRPECAPLMPPKLPPLERLPPPRCAGTNREVLAVDEPCKLRKPLQKKVDFRALFGFSFMMVFRQLTVLWARLL
jgi:hypothetical protein